MARKKRGRRAYATDLTDAQWALIAPLIPEAEPGGRPRRCGACLATGTLAVGHDERVVNPIPHALALPAAKVIGPSARAGNHVAGAAMPSQPEESRAWR